jgi:NAD(P)-dependent dehydrogenase (short-subunit alcohol dehydrogenase family)
MDGAGADGTATANYAAYGASKAGITHLTASLAAERNAHNLDVGVHTLSPGMVLTGLLLEGATERNKQVFNVLCEHPETVAAYLVPRVRTVIARQESSTYIRFLTSVPSSAVVLASTDAEFEVGLLCDLSCAVNAWPLSLRHQRELVWHSSRSNVCTASHIVSRLQMSMRLESF